MSGPQKIVVSASRRTDIPAFYMDWFMGRIADGVFESVNPYNRKVRRIPASPDDVHTIVFWSKNFGPFLDGEYGERLLAMGYHLYFSFTVNSENPVLEPRVPPLGERLDQLASLCSRFSPHWVDWRFDPICIFTTKDRGKTDNLMQFPRIAEAAAALGIKRCITSFMDPYKKVLKRVRSMAGFSFVEPAIEDKTDILLHMNDRLKGLDIQLHLCCEKDVFEALPPDTGIAQSACIPNQRLKTLFGGEISLARDSGQRARSGCGCRVSVDIGAYHLHPCRHNCLFCYANPSKC